MREEVTSLQGPVEIYRGHLTIRIPLAAGGDKFVGCTRGIGEIEGEFLNIIIRPWLAEKLGLCAGSLVSIDNNNGKFNMSPIAAEESDLA